MVNSLTELSILWPGWWQKIDLNTRINTSVFCLVSSLCKIYFTFRDHDENNSLLSLLLFSIDRPGKATHYVQSLITHFVSPFHFQLLSHNVGNHELVNFWGKGQKVDGRIAVWAKQTFFSPESFTKIIMLIQREKERGTQTSLFFYFEPKQPTKSLGWLDAVK